MKIKLFPLSIVAYPNKYIPLHIFEERYKKLITESIRDHSEFGIIYQDKKGLADIGCTVLVKNLLNQYSDGRMDILCVGKKIFKLNKNLLIDGLTIGEINYLPDLYPIPASLFEPLKEKYLKIIITMGKTEDLKNHMSKTTNFELLEMIQLPTVIEQKLITLPSEERRAGMLNKIFTSVLDQASSFKSIKKFTS